MRTHQALLAAAIPFLATALSAPVSAQSAPPAAPAGLRISTPLVHDNLAVYLLRGPSAPGPVPLTLSEAMVEGKAIVHETGNVSQLVVENVGAEEVFIQAGDIVKGGQQDRVLTISLLVPPRSGRIDIAAYCVEQGRWSARGSEDVKRFASSEKALPSKAAKLAMLAPRPAPPSPSVGVSPPDMRTRSISPSQEVGSRLGGGSRQSEMWASVAEAQRKLSGNVGAEVAAAASASSLQLSLENQRLADARKVFMEALQAAGQREDDVVGYVFAVGGKLNSGDVYASNGLFRKMWTKQLEAAVTEAIAEKSASKAAAPSIDDVKAFLDRAENGKLAAPTVTDPRVVRETKDAGTALLTETRRKEGALLHRSYLAY